jgi:hypothetical protein
MFKNWKSPVSRPYCFFIDISNNMVPSYLYIFILSNFFKCQKPHYSRHGLPVNSYDNFTYSFPTLQIILIPTLTRSNRFWFISLDAHTCNAPPRQSHKSCMWHSPTCGEAHNTSKTLLALLIHLFWGVHIAGRKQSFTTAESNHLLLGVCTLVAEIKHFLVL